MMDQSEVERRLIQLRIDLDNIKTQQDALVRKALSTATAVSRIPTTTTPAPIITPPSAPNIIPITLGFDIFAAGTITWSLPIRPGLSGNFLDVIATAATGPSTTALVLDIQLSTDSGVTWNTILGATLQLTAGQRVSTVVNTFAIKTASVGHLLRGKVLSGGIDAADVSMLLRISS